MIRFDYPTLTERFFPLGRDFFQRGSPLLQRGFLQTGNPFFLLWELRRNSPPFALVGCAAFTRTRIFFSLSQTEILLYAQLAQVSPQSKRTFSFSFFFVSWAERFECAPRKGRRSGRVLFPFLGVVTFSTCHGFPPFCWIPLFLGRRFHPSPIDPPLLSVDTPSFRLAPTFFLFCELPAWWDTLLVRRTVG